MSGNSSASPAPDPAARPHAPPGLDPRVQRTRDRLGDALVTLMQERPFDSIRVQDVLDRAGVGRSTFYAHFSDKDDLFFSDVDAFFGCFAPQLSRNAEASERVAPARELFAHVADVRRFHAALVTSGKIHDVLELGRGHFARAIAQRLAELPRSRGLAVERRAALAHAFAGALFALLTWWLRSGTPVSPEEMDALYHDLVWRGADRLAADAEPRGAARPGC